MDLIKIVGDIAIEEIVNIAVDEIMESGEDVDSYLININVGDIDVKKYVEEKIDFIKEEIKKRLFTTEEKNK